MKKTFRRLITENQDIVRQVLKVYHDADQETLRFARLTKLRCPNKCGACCQGAKVEASILEMLPVAVSLWDSGQALSYLKRIKKNYRRKRCLLFQGFSRRGQGRCGSYSFRPLVCRLFAFAVNKDKYGSYVYGGCRVIRTSSPRQFHLVQDRLKTSSLKTMADFATRLSGVGVTYDQKPLPINIALRLALEKIGFELENYKLKCTITSN